MTSSPATAEYTPSSFATGTVFSVAFRSSVFDQMTPSENSYASIPLLVAESAFWIVTVSSDVAKDITTVSLPLNKRVTDTSEDT